MESRSSARSIGEHVKPWAAPKRTARACLYKESLREIMRRKQISVVRDMPRNGAANVMRAKVDPMEEVATMIRNHLDGIGAGSRTHRAQRPP